MEQSTDCVPSPPPGTNADFHAALRTFEESHPDAAKWLHWLFDTLETNSAHLAALEARYRAIRVIQEETRAIQQEHDERLRAWEILNEDYAALQDAHAALQLEHADLEAAYFVLQRRASKEE